MSFRPSSAAGSSARLVTSRRPAISSTRAPTTRLVCLSLSRSPGRSSRSDIQQTVASSATDARRPSPAPTIMSPRSTSAPSSRCSVTDSGGKASSSSPSAVSTATTRVGIARRGGSPPRRPAAPHRRPAARPRAPGSRAARGSAGRRGCGRPPASRLSSQSSSGGPAYQGVRSERSTTLSPCSAEIGMKRHVVQRQRREVAHHGVEGALVEVDQVHLVHADHGVGNPQQRGDQARAAGTAPARRCGRRRGSARRPPSRHP